MFYYMMFLFNPRAIARFFAHPVVGFCSWLFLMGSMVMIFGRKA